MPLETCPKGHVYFSERDASCPRCGVPGPEELFAPVDFPVPPPRIIDDANPCFHTANNEARVTDHYSKLLRGIVESTESVPEKARKVFSFFLWVKADGDTGWFRPALEVEAALQDLGDEAVEMLLRAQRHRPELRPLAEDLLARRFRKADVPIMCDTCGRNLAEAMAMKHVCQKCLSPFELSIFDGEIWCRCPACQTMIHESDRDAEVRICSCGKRYGQKEVNRFLEEARKRKIAEALDA